MNFKYVVRECIMDLHSGGPAAIGSIVTRLKAAGAVRNIHLGKKSFTTDETVEWYAGQILDVLEERQLFAVNSLINCVDKFAPVD
jgi:hypothetical protein